MFQFMTSTKIVFGEGSLDNSLTLLNQFGYSALLLTGEDSQRSESIIRYFKQQNIRYQQVAILGEPMIAMIEELAAKGRKLNPEMIIAIGGGSVIDAGKALAGLIPNQGSVYDYIEVVGRNMPLRAEPLPFIAIPTTAGTGAEVTQNAVLKSAQENVKVSIRNPEMLPNLAIIDPTLTYGMDKSLSGRTGMDAFVHLVESYVCGEPNPITDMICEEGLRRFSSAILLACEDDNPRARSDMSFVAMLGGMALTNAKLGAAHALASSLGGRISAPHGLITAELSPYVMQENIDAATEAGRSDILNRYRQLSVLLTGRMDADVDDCILWTSRLLKRLELGTLVEYGLCEVNLDQVANDALRANAIRGNPIPLNQQRLKNILQQASILCPFERNQEQSSAQQCKKDQVINHDSTPQLGNI
ncbi:iron-containing alcohol dehydrogenase [Vibrio sp. SS-MA-C1-2]|uniref:iron-containing alcohol dehydrogenase n=1 Tax=Vibrio sp. SS-MA-C1-2 TaxID=2908646 RepID=UPI001F1683D1|nr:iron-containing alcohol dehydrogenase [Vibrio sp. SS-MA-C1-2]UJF19991.1 iron-containing alcohol dehydrogenase [Vibrio sp. SS-MA-C1-2]